jgi:hypothetical protein
MPIDDGRPGERHRIFSRRRALFGAKHEVLWKTFVSAGA